jgi:ABC-type Na+ efflux pump permease subunit
MDSATALTIIGIVVPAVLALTFFIVRWLVNGALEYVNSKDKEVQLTLARAIESGDNTVARAVDGLTSQLQGMATIFQKNQDGLAEKINDIKYEVTHTNDGSTVKGSLIELKSSQATDRQRLLRVEEKVDDLQKQMRGHHPYGKEASTEN